MAGRSAAFRLRGAGLAAAATSMSMFMLQSPMSADSVMSTSDLISTLKGAGAGAVSAPPVREQQQQPPVSKPNADAPRTSAVGFDPEALERGATALREINASVHAKKVFELMKKQEETRQTEENARRAEFQAIQAQHETERQRVLYDEQKKLVQQQAQSKAQLARYEDELARKRMQAEHEAQRVRNMELVKLQEESGVRQEQVRRATEENIQAQRRQTEKEKAEIERETLRVKALADAEGRALEAKMTEDLNRRMLVERVNVETEKWLAVVNSSFKQVGGGINYILTERDKLAVAIMGVTVLAAGVYSSREGARVLWGYVERVLGRPSLLRETSISRFDWVKRLSPFAAQTPAFGKLPGAGPSQAAKSRGLGEIILHPSLLKRVEQVAYSTASAKKYAAPYRNMLFYGPAGTGKTMAAKELAKSDLDYAIMTGGNVNPLASLGPVTKIGQLFDWARTTRKGLFLFIDEADAFLCERNNVQMSEALRSALGLGFTCSYPFAAQTSSVGRPSVPVPSRIGNSICELRYQGLKATEQAVRSQGVEDRSHANLSSGVAGSRLLFQLKHSRPYSFQPFVGAGGCAQIYGLSVGPDLLPLKRRNPFLGGGVRFKSKNKIKKAKQKKREILHKIKRIRIFAKKRKEEMNPEERLEFRLHRNRKKMELIQQAIAKFPVQEIPPRDPDMEVLTAEQLHYLKKIGYKNKNYVPVGRRGIYGGTIQNIHLHWKKHETVQVEIAGFTRDEIKVMADQLARLSGGVLIDIHRANIVILYRGRNYVQPKQLIPMKTLDKRKALALSKLQQSLKALEENDKKVVNELNELRKENELRASGKFVEKVPVLEPKLEDPDEYSEWSSGDVSDSDEGDTDVEALISEADDETGDDVEYEDDKEENQHLL